MSAEMFNLFVLILGYVVCFDIPTIRSLTQKGAKIVSRDHVLKRILF